MLVAIIAFAVIHPIASEAHRDVAAFIVTVGDAFNQGRRYHHSTFLNLDKGFNLLETATKVVPQGTIVGTAKESWKFVWKRMMAELAPQDQKGAYQRPKYAFDERIGSYKHPDESGRYHVYLGNPCPVRMS